MAEIFLKVGDASVNPEAYKDGDIVCAFNDNRIRCVHAQHICFKRLETGRRFKLNGAGLVPNASLAKDYLQTVHQFKYERLGKETLRITQLSDNQSIEITSNIPFQNSFDKNKTQYMDIPLFVKRSIRTMRETNARGIPVFGEPGKEIWYGGKTDVSASNISQVWDAIETKTENVRADLQFKLWPSGAQDLKSHLSLLVNDFDDTEAESLAEPLMDLTDPENPVLLKKRKNMVSWKDIILISELTQTNVLDSTVSVDLRTKGEHTRIDIVVAK